VSTRPFLRSSRVDTSARKTYDVIDEPVGPEYDALLDSALSQCSTVVLTVREEGLEPTAAAVLDELQPHRQQAGGDARGAMARFALDRDTVSILKRAARGLYAWRHPGLPENLCLLRADGSPWLVSIAGERLGYLELAPFEKLLLGRAAPGLAAVLAHQAARDAILAYFERRYESHLEMLGAEIDAYGRNLADEGRDGLVEALGDWLESEEQARVTVALEAVGALRLHELRGEVETLQRAMTAETVPVPQAYRSNLVLRERWKARRRRQLERVLEQIAGS
jgi:hypothetical protein